MIYLLLLLTRSFLGSKWDAVGKRATLHSSSHCSAVHRWRSLPNSMETSIFRYHHNPSRSRTGSPPTRTSAHHRTWSTATPGTDNRISGPNALCSGPYTAPHKPQLAAPYTACTAASAAGSATRADATRSGNTSWSRPGFYSTRRHSPPACTSA